MYRMRVTYSNQTVIYFDHFSKSSVAAILAAQERFAQETPLIITAKSIINGEISAKAVPK